MGMRMLLRVFRILSFIAVAALIALMLRAGDPGKPTWWLLGIPFGLWAVGPTILPYLIARRPHARRWVAPALLAFFAVSSLWSAGVYYHAFFVSASSTAGLALIFIPLYQWIALALVAVVIVVSGRIRRRA